MKRRAFLKSALGAGVGWMAFPGGLRGAADPNDTLQLGVIGTGRMGHADMKQALQQGLRPELNARVVAVCDVDAKRLALARHVVERFYQEQGEGRVEVQGFGDFRELLGHPGIDAVLVVTPDHWHGLIAIAAANAGKHVYVEKPMVYRLAEGQALVRAVRRNKVTLQTGSQQRSSRRFRRICEIVRNNWLGELEQVEVRIPTDGGTGADVRETPPGTLDYDLWLGPAREAPYAPDRVHPQEGLGRPGWMQIEDYCRGMICNWGAHMFDIVQWGLGADHTGPVEVQCRGDFPDRGLWNVHVGFAGEAVYESGVRVLSGDGEPGVRFRMKNGWASVSRDGYECSDSDLLIREPGEGEIALGESRNHMEDFLLSIRHRREPICPVEIGHRSNTVCLLHHASMKLGGRTIKWDPRTESPVDDAEADAVLSVPFRSPWRLEG